MAETYFRFKSRVNKQLDDHEERLGVAEDRLNRHEQDIADLHTATQALTRMGKRHAAMRAPKRRPSRRPNAK